MEKKGEVGKKVFIFLGSYFLQSWMPIYIPGTDLEYLLRDKKNIRQTSFYFVCASIYDYA